MSAAYPAATEWSVRVESDIDATVAQMTVVGRRERPLWCATTAALQKCPAEHPEALIVDLTALDDPASRSATTWLKAQRDAAAKEPAVQLALCVPPQLPLADRLIPLARPRRGMPLDERGRGLRMVSAAAVTWGSLPTRTGKVVWAIPRARESAPASTGPR